MPYHYQRAVGVYWDIYGNHAADVCKYASYSLWRISKSTHLLDRNNTEKLVHAFVSCRIYYCNSSLFGICTLRLIVMIPGYPISPTVCENTRRKAIHPPPLVFPNIRLGIAGYTKLHNMLGV